MQFTPDALTLGSLSLEWGRLGVIAGLLLLTSLAGRLKLLRVERATWVAIAVGLVAARLAFAASQWEATWRDGPLAILDIRAGGWNLWVGLLAGAVMLLWQLGRDTIKLVPAGLLSVAVMLAPNLLKPLLQPAGIQLEPSATVQRLEIDGRLTPLRWSELPPNALVNVWATWCGPCRQEMPLLSEYAQNGKPVYLLNDGEPLAKVRAFLEKNGLRATPVLLDTANARAVFQLSALPTTLEVRAGRVVKRHLGPMNRAQLEAWLAELQ